MENRNKNSSSNSSTRISRKSSTTVSDHDLMAFSALLKRNDPRAMEANEAYNKSKDLLQFHRDIKAALQCPKSNENPSTVKSEEKPLDNRTSEVQKATSNASKIKRGICHKFQLGLCKYGDNCTYAHEIAPGRSTAADSTKHMSSSTDKTKSVQSDPSPTAAPATSQSKGSSRIVQVVATPTPTSQPVAVKQEKKHPCLTFQKKGTCRLGNTCRFAHISSSDQTEDPATTSGHNVISRTVPEETPEGFGSQQDRKNTNNNNNNNHGNRNTMNSNNNNSNNNNMSGAITTTSRTTRERTLSESGSNNTPIPSNSISTSRGNRESNSNNNNNNSNNTSKNNNNNKNQNQLDELSALTSNTRVSSTSTDKKFSGNRTTTNIEENLFSSTDKLREQMRLLSLMRSGGGGSVGGSNSLKNENIVTKKVDDNDVDENDDVSSSSMKGLCIGFNFNSNNNNNTATNAAGSSNSNNSLPGNAIKSMDQPHQQHYVQHSQSLSQSQYSEPWLQGLSPATTSSTTTALSGLPVRSNHNYHVQSEQNNNHIHNNGGGDGHNQQTTTWSNDLSNNIKNNDTDLDIDIDIDVDIDIINDDDRDWLESQRRVLLEGARAADSSDSNSNWNTSNNTQLQHLLHLPPHHHHSHESNPSYAFFDNNNNNNNTLQQNEHQHHLDEASRWSISSMPQQQQQPLGGGGGHSFSDNNKDDQMRFESISSEQQHHQQQQQQRNEMLSGYGMDPNNPNNPNPFFMMSNAFPAIPPGYPGSSSSSMGMGMGMMGMSPPPLPPHLQHQGLFHPLLSPPPPPPGNFLYGYSGFGGLHASFMQGQGQSQGQGLPQELLHQWGGFPGGGGVSELNQSLGIGTPSENQSISPVLLDTNNNSNNNNNNNSSSSTQQLLRSVSGGGGGAIANNTSSSNKGLPIRQPVDSHKNNNSNSNTQQKYPHHLFPSGSNMTLSTTSAPPGLELGMGMGMGMGFDLNGMMTTENTIKSEILHKAEEGNDNDNANDNDMDMVLDAADAELFGASKQAQKLLSFLRTGPRNPVALPTQLGRNSSSPSNYTNTSSSNTSLDNLPSSHSMPGVFSVNMGVAGLSRTQPLSQSQSQSSYNNNTQHVYSVLKPQSQLQHQQQQQQSQQQQQQQYSHSHSQHSQLTQMEDKNSMFLSNIPSDSNDPLVLVRKMSESESESGSVATGPAAITSTKKQHRFITRISGFVDTFRMKDRELCLSFRPQENILVRWRLPDSFWVGRDQLNTLLTVALFRYGFHNNINHVFYKRLTHKKPSPLPLISGDFTCFAPKDAGTFVFRIFDARPEFCGETLAASGKICVELWDNDVTASLKRLVELFTDPDTKNNIPRILSQMHSAFEGCRTHGRRFISLPPCREVIGECLKKLLDIVQTAMSQLAELSRIETVHGEKMKIMAANAAAAGTGEGTAAGTGEGTGEDSDVVELPLGESHWSEKRLAIRIHADAMDVLSVMKTNNAAWDILDVEHQRTVIAVMNFFCPLQNRFFESQESMDSARLSRLHFLPSPMAPIGMSCVAPPVVTALNKSISELLPKLWPSHDFSISRETTKLRIQAILQSSGILPFGTELGIFGSSRNNFGSDGADLDMCLIMPTALTSLEMMDKAEVIEKMGEYLKARGGMENVQVRSTARIPIVLFKDPVSGLDCDISFNNPLALKNTALLNVYSRADERVRALAFILKHWAKARRINDPQQGTLSSYGHILCLIYFLQTRERPVVPSLQQLPEDWPGKSLPMGKPVLPVKWEVNPVDNSRCNTYFYNPPSTSAGMTLLQNFSSKNRQTLAELLCEFFHFYSWKFDYRHDVVSVRLGGSIYGVLSKLEKAETSCWFMNEKLCIEDPFELSYDVAHVLRLAKKDGQIRNEMLRAYTLIRRACVYNPTATATSSSSPNDINNDNDHDHSSSSAVNESIPMNISPEELLALIMEEKTVDVDTNDIDSDMLTGTTNTASSDTGGGVLESESVLQEMMSVVVMPLSVPESDIEKVIELIPVMEIETETETDAMIALISEMEIGRETETVPLDTMTSMTIPELETMTETETEIETGIEPMRVEITTVIMTEETVTESEMEMEMVVTPNEE
eukprot:gene4985-9961_t